MKKLACFKFRDKDFGALHRENDSSESSVSLSLMYAHADEEKRNQKEYKDERKVLLEEEDEKNINNLRG